MDKLKLVKNKILEIKTRKGNLFMSPYNLGKEDVCNELLSFVVSLQDVPCDGCVNKKGCLTCENGELRETMQENSIQNRSTGEEMAYLEEKIKTFTEAHKGKDADKLLAEMRGEEPVSEELEEELPKVWDRETLDEYAYQVAYDLSNDWLKETATWDDVETAVKLGAKWQAEQFEKNRLKHCNSITNKQAELEQGFIDQHLDKYKRMPTYLDAIEYGMNLQKEQMMAKAIDGDITFDYYGDGDKTYGCIAHNSFCLEDFGLKDRNKVKVIVIKKG